MWIKTVDKNECAVNYTNMDSCLWMSFTEAEELPNYTNSNGRTLILLSVTDRLDTVFFLNAMITPKKHMIFSKHL